MAPAVKNIADAQKLVRIGAKSQCRSRQCPCFAADRECDPDVCRNCWIGCGDGSLGVPSQRGDNYECRNMKLLLKQQKRGRKSTNKITKHQLSIPFIKALKDSGGCLERTTVEDMHIAVRAHLHEWKFIFLNDVENKMFVSQKWNRSWSLVATIASVVALVSAINLFLYPVVPSFDYLSFTKSQSTCVPINGSFEEDKDKAVQKFKPVFDLNAQFPTDLHKAVVYCGAPWTAEIGRWLAGCNSITSEIKVVEQISVKRCKNDCSGQGICNYELGQCCCFHGFHGETCS